MATINADPVTRPENGVPAVTQPTVETPKASDLTSTPTSSATQPVEGATTGTAPDAEAQGNDATPSVTTASPDRTTATTVPKSASPSLGPRVRMRPLSPSELPAHPDLAQHQTTGSLPELQPFVSEILSEASSFMTQYLPQHFTVKADSKSAPPSNATVKTLAKDISVSEIPQSARTGNPETWFARASTHVNERAIGTADWDEFEAGLLDDHSQHEADYTPEVYDAHEVLSWNDIHDTIAGYEKVRASIYEMAHKIPPPLNNRVFSVLVVTARSTTTPASFIVVQIPVDISKVDKALYSNGRNKNEGNSAMKKKDVTLGQYVSVERCELLDEGKKVLWQMATASDAKGNLPMWAQKMAVPGAIVKDVSFFMEWTQKRREGKAT